MSIRNAQFVKDGNLAMQTWQSTVHGMPCIVAYSRDSEESINILRVPIPRAWFEQIARASDQTDQNIRAVEAFLLKIREGEGKDWEVKHLPDPSSRS